MRMQSIKWTGRKFAALTLLGASALPAVPAAATEIVFNVFTGPRHFINDPFKAWAREIQEATKGRVTVKFLPTSAAPPPKQIDGVVSGQFDAAFVFHGFTAKRAVGPQFGILPFVLDGNAEAGSIAYQRAYDKFFGTKNEFGKVGLNLVGADGSAVGVDIGGTNPGTEGYANRSIFEEGLRFPPLRLYEAGRPVVPLLRYIEANVRDCIALIRKIRGK